MPPGSTEEKWSPHSRWYFSFVAWQSPVDRLLPSRVWGMAVRRTPSVGPSTLL
jgi:hypothetical protein